LARPKKSLGQHFLTSRSILQNIVSAADVGPDDTVVEIGPGLGSLTQSLADAAGKVVAIELDDALAAALTEACLETPNVSVIHADAREIAIDSLLGPGHPPYKVVANLPYYAALPILRRFLEAEHPPSVLVVMIQLEVARAMVAQPGDMSLVSIAVQAYGTPRMVCRVPPGAFNPPPKVTSAVVRIDMNDKPIVGAPHMTNFFKVVRGGFSAPRKQLLNSLSQGLRLPRDSTAEALTEASIDAKLRPEDLSLEDWANLANALERKL